MSLRTPCWRLDHSDRNDRVVTVGLVLRWLLVLRRLRCQPGVAGPRSAVRLQAGEERIPRRTAVQRHLEQRAPHAVPAIGQAAVDERNEAPEAASFAVAPRALSGTEATAHCNRAMQTRAASIPLHDRQAPANPSQLREILHGTTQVSEGGSAQGVDDWVVNRAGGVVSGIDPELPARSSRALPSRVSFGASYGVRDEFSFEPSWPPPEPSAA